MGLERSAIKIWDLIFARPLQAWNCGDFAASAILCHVRYVISRVAWLSTWGHAVGLGQAPKSDITCDEAAAFPGEREVELCDGLNGRLGKEMVGLVGRRQRFASLRQG